MQQHPIILFDGVCNLCNGLVQWIIKRDRHKKFRFGSLQSTEALALLAPYGNLAGKLTTVVVLDGDEVLTESKAIMRMAYHLGGIYRLASAGHIIPAFIRDSVYRFVGKHRYFVFGKRDICMVPTDDLMDRFI